MKALHSEMEIHIKKGLSGATIIICIQLGSQRRYIRVLAAFKTLTWNVT